MVLYTSGEYLQPLFPKFSPGDFLQTEISALELVVGDILKEMGQREVLGKELLSSLESRIMKLRSELMNLPITYTFSFKDRQIALEQSIEQLAMRKTGVEEATSSELLELKKMLWEKWLLLEKKKAQRNLLSAVP